MTYLTVIVIPEDNTIIVNGDARRPTGVTYPEGVRAIQWVGQAGQIEYTGRGQEYTEDLALIQPFIEAYALAVTRDNAPTPWSQVKDANLLGVRATFEATINRLNGIAARFQRSGDMPTALGCDAAVRALIAIPTAPEVLAAGDDVALKLAVKTCYAQAVALLPMAAKLEFRSMEA